MFGRKGLAPAKVTVSTLDELIAAQRHIATPEHAKVSGEMFFQLCYQQLARSGGPVGIENFLGLLASAAGVACIATSLIEWEFVQHQPYKGNPILAQTVGGETFYAGDLPTRYLYESQLSVLNIALPYAMKHGARIDHDFLHEPVNHAMRCVGTPHFAVPRLPSEHLPNATPRELAELAWPQAENTFDTVQLAITHRPAALGFALGKALDIAAGSIDPLMMARIVVEHAVPMSMIDPASFWSRLQEIKANAA